MEKQPWDAVSPRLNQDNVKPLNTPFDLQTLRYTKRRLLESRHFISKIYDTLTCRVVRACMFISQYVKISRRFPLCVQAHQFRCYRVLNTLHTCELSGRHAKFKINVYAHAKFNIVVSYESPSNRFSAVRNYTHNVRVLTYKLSPRAFLNSKYPRIFVSSVI